MLFSLFRQSLIPLNFEFEDCLSDDYRWFSTDDIGYYDDMGLLYIHGFCRNPENLFNRVHEYEIEQILCSYPDIVESCAINLDNKHFAAIVVPKESSVNSDYLDTITAYLHGNSAK